MCIHYTTEAEVTRKKTLKGKEGSCQLREGAPIIRLRGTTSNCKFLIDKELFPLLLKGDCINFREKGVIKWVSLPPDSLPPPVPLLLFHLLGALHQAECTVALQLFHIQY